MEGAVLKINNGFLVIEAPDLLSDLRKEFGNNILSVKTGWTASVYFQQALIIIGDKQYPFNPVGKAAQELIVTGGLENWVKEHI